MGLRLNQQCNQQLNVKQFSNHILLHTWGATAICGCGE